MNYYANEWDKYVEKHPHNPGEEWGSPGHWESIFGRFFYGVGTWKRAIEIGAGAGKYTKKVLATSATCEIAAVDVSKRFLDVLTLNVNKPPYTHPDGRFRVHPFLVDDFSKCESYSPLAEVAIKKDWPLGTVDAVYSIDAMVHVEWPLVVSYIDSAYQVLRQGGVLILSLANGCSEGGFTKLKNEIPILYRTNLNPDGKFHYTSPDLVTKALEMGFNIEAIDTRSRDIFVVASKK